MSTVVKTLRWLLAQWSINLASAMAYRISFLTQVVFMLLNDIFLLFFWWIILQLVPDIGGWGMADIWLMYGLAAGGFSLVAIFAGNFNRLSTLIAEGQLDYYLALPKNVLLHVLVSNTSFSAVGDLIFGLVMGAMGCRAHGASYLLFLFFMFTAGSLLCAFSVITNSLAFFIGRSEAISQQLTQAMTSFSMYPGTIFQGAARFIVLFLLPAGFMTHIPVETLRHFDRANIWIVLAANLVLWLLAILLFYAGLRRYESGNQVTLRG
ncbi:MAG: hypothetical protein GX033_01820 [Firmicutes bacterium]|nr:hypothetical protein [Bacillota bacterium]